MNSSSIQSTSLPTMVNASEDSASISSLQQLVVSSSVVLKQAIDLLDAHLTDDLLVVQSKFMPGSSIGKHLRHARDHFELLLDTVSDLPPYVFSYDTRVRNTPMETRCSEAKKALLQTIDRLDLALAVKKDTPMTLHAVTPALQSFETTFGRELWFAVLHAVHHWSMVRVIAGEMGITLSEDFGFAPSTLVYQDRVAPLGKAKI